MAKSKRGGARPGAGRPLKTGEPLVPWEIRVPPWVVEVIRRHGSTDGARQAIIQYACSVVPMADDEQNVHG